MKNLNRNKIILVTIIIVLTILYFVVQNIIANYTEDDYNREEECEILVSKDNLEVSKENTTNVGIEKFDNDMKINDGKITEESDEKEDSDNSNDSLKEKNITSNDKIYVYVTGEVNNPGVVVLNSESRIIDAINAVGGTTPKANVSKVNLVYILEDGMKINIPNDDDLKNNPDFDYITLGSGDGINDYLSKNNLNKSIANSSNYKSDTTIVNINTATQTELETLPGIGPSLALKIINYRNENGKFSSIDDIKNVNGIGESKFNDLKDYIIV